jgi:hypothetical protein
VVTVREGEVRVNESRESPNNDDGSERLGNEELVLPLDPEKNIGSDSVADFSVSVPLPVLKGGVLHVSRSKLDPPDDVFGDAAKTPTPRLDLLVLERLVADANSSSRSVRELVRLKELLRLGAITRGSPGYRYVWLETPASSVARV